MRQHLRKGRITRQIIVDSDTGLILNESVTEQSYVAGTKETFFLMFPSMLDILMECSDINLKLYSALLKRYAQGMEFGVSKSLKRVLAQECKCSISSISNTMTVLVKRDILIRLGRNHYRLNPRHVYYGSSTKRMVELKDMLQKK